VLDKIRSFYGFTRMPFGRDLAPGMLHRHNDHTQAAARIAYGIDSHGIAVITGEVGVGKTVAARAAVDRVDAARHHLIYIADPTAGVRGIYQQIVTALGELPRFHTATLIAQTRSVLAAEVSERGRTPILLIDEAHILTRDGLEAVRLLTNHDLDTGAPFATILLGQPDLAAKMRHGVMAALDQRVTVRHHMTGMSADETAQYIHHHLSLAGRSDSLFNDDAITLIHANSRGKPRAVNNLALAALLAARINDQPIVDEANARTAITETTDRATTT
jgi:type II secretory pathway predicted ATPase ExeA